MLLVLSHGCARHFPTVDDAAVACTHVVASCLIMLV
jgi:hypothetical protein